MANAHDVLEQVTSRLKNRGDTFLDSEGEALFAQLKGYARSAEGNQQAIVDALREIEHRRSQKVE